MDKKEWLHFAKIGGILALIGGASALVITGVNAITAPVIQAAKDSKASAGLKKVFENVASSDEAVAVSDKTYVTSYTKCYDSSKEWIGTIFQASGSVQYGSLEMMIGITGEPSDPSLGKVYLITDSLSWGTTFEANYLDKYNADPSDATLNAVSCGATVGATLAKSMITEAREFYTALYNTGAVAKATQEDVAAIYGGTAVIGDRDTSFASTGDLSRRYVVYADDYKGEEIGYIYAGVKGEMTFCVGMEGDFNDVAYAGVTCSDESLSASVASFNESKDASVFAGSDAALSVKAALEAAKAHYEENQANTNARRALALYSTLGGASVSSFTSVSNNNVNDFGYYDISDASGSFVGSVYHGKRQVTEGSGSEAIITYADLLVAIHGEKSSPIVGKIDLVTLSHNAPSVTNAEAKETLTADFTDETPSSTYVKDGATLITSATYTSGNVTFIVRQANVNYKKR